MVCRAAGQSFLHGEVAGGVGRGLHLELLHDLLEGGLQLLGHCALHGRQLGQGAVLLQPEQASMVILTENS